MEKIFDYDKALERFMGEKDILLEVLPSYLESLKKGITEIKKLNIESQIKEVRDIAHSIKGSSLNLEINILGKIAEEVEDRAFDGDSGAVSSLLPTFLNAAEDVIKELNKYI